MYKLKPADLICMFSIDNGLLFTIKQQHVDQSKFFLLLLSSLLSLSVFYVKEYSKT